MRIGLTLCLVWLGLCAGATRGAAADAVNPATWHNEPYRPQFHFTADKGWLNDPNGLVFYKGEYHLFFQHNPNGTSWVNDLSWGHAVSRDLLHWKYLPEAVPPTPLPGGKMAGSWSGTGFVDFNNSGQFQTGAEKPIVLAWTATNLGQCLTFSNDAGRTFTKFDGNPIVPMAPNRHGDWDRDPDVFWYAPGKHWVLIMSVTGKGYVFHNSTDLRHWTQESVLPGMFECPNCFEFPVDGDANNRKWVIWDASSKYLIGSFDGMTFSREAGPFVLDSGKNYYAAQTWSDVPDGRRIGIGWMRDSKFPGMPFNQQMGIPFELSLRNVPGQGLRLTKYPVKEVESLRYEPKHWDNQTLEPGKDLLTGIWGDTFDIEADLAVEKSTQFRFTLRDEPVAYTDGRLTCGTASVAVQPIEGHLKLRILLDRTSVEVFANGGAVSLTNAILASPTDRKISLVCEGAPLQIPSLSIWRMHSVWTEH